MYEEEVLEQGEEEPGAPGREGRGYNAAPGEGDVPKTFPERSKSDELT